MKRSQRIISAACCLALFLTLAGSALAAPGGKDDPAVSVSYLEQVWAKTLLQACREQAGQRLSGVYADSLAHLSQRLAEQNQASYAAAGKQRMLGSVILKQGDVLLPEPGCKVMLYEGDLLSDASLIDVSAGQPAGQSLVLRHTYMQSAQTSPGLTVRSAVAELWVNGVCRIAPSVGTDFGALAQALEKMGLFRGMTEGYGLLGSTTRAQGLTMFLRLLGKEKEALSCTAAIPFTDVPRTHWAYPYVAYAYQNGLTNGTSANRFSPEASVTAQHYVTFLLRAQHYAEPADFTYETALTASVEKGVFTRAEVDSFPGNLQRSGLVYLSYYGLYGQDAKSGKTVLAQLLDSGVVTVQSVADALLTVRSPRRV